MLIKYPNKFNTTITILLFCLLLSVIMCSVSIAAQPKAGDTIPPLTLPVPYDQAGKTALGLSETATTFTLVDLKSELILIEIIGVYCPQCFKQAPGFNNLYARLNKGKMKGRVTMFALAAGGTDGEIEQLLKSGQYKFPVVRDDKYEIHKILGEPKTPFTIICRQDGTILDTHLGIIEDIDKFYGQIKGFLIK
ncbi:MAG: TlpA family protein disulfide reductase [Desulfamplus sp.]|nr:TlpA family protein disulfide reductase [Desulfamplus sp.]